MTHAYNPRIQKTGNFETSWVYTAISRSARVIQRGSVSKHKGKNARHVVCPCNPQIWEVRIGRPQFEVNLYYRDVSYSKQNEKQVKPLIFFFKENNSFKPNLDIIRVERNGKWGRVGCHRFLNVFTTQKAQVTERPNAQLTKRTLWRGKGRKANGIATETKRDIVAVPNLRARKGADCSGNIPWFQTSEIEALTSAQHKGESPEAGGRRNNVHVLDGWMESRLQSGWPRWPPNFTTEELRTWIVYSNQIHLSI